MFCELGARAGGGGHFLARSLSDGHPAGLCHREPCVPCILLADQIERGLQSSVWRVRAGDLGARGRKGARGKELVLRIQCVEITYCASFQPNSHSHLLFYPL